MTEPFLKENPSVSAAGDPAPTEVPPKAASTTAKPALFRWLDQKLTERNLLLLMFAAAVASLGVAIFCELFFHPVYPEAVIRYTEKLPAPEVIVPVNIHDATVEQLAALEGIGPVLAERIVAYAAAHPIHAMEELLAVEGIGELRLETLKMYFYAE